MLDDWIWGFPKIRGTFFRSPYHKDYRKLIIGVSLFWETTILYECPLGIHQGMVLRNPHLWIHPNKDDDSALTKYDMWFPDLLGMPGKSRR